MPGLFGRAARGRDAGVRRGRGVFQWLLLASVAGTFVGAGRVIRGVLLAPFVRAGRCGKLGAAARGAGGDRAPSYWITLAPWGAGAAVDACARGVGVAGRATSSRSGSGRGEGGLAEGGGGQHLSAGVSSRFVLLSPLFFSRTGFFGFMGVTGLLAFASGRPRGLRWGRPGVALYLTLAVTVPAGGVSTSFQERLPDCPLGAAGVCGFAGHGLATWERAVVKGSPRHFLVGGGAGRCCMRWCFSAFGGVISRAIRIGTSSRLRCWYADRLEANPEQRVVTNERLQRAGGGREGDVSGRARRRWWSFGESALLPGRPDCPFSSWYEGAARGLT